MKTFKLKYSFPLLFLFLLFNLSTFANAANIDYGSVKIDANSTTDSVTINGAILQIGNQLLCLNGDSSWEQDADDNWIPAGINGSDGATCIAPTEGTPNNSWAQYKTKIDTDASAPYNSMAKLVILPDDEIIFARLYWSARATDSTEADSSEARQIKIKGPLSTGYTQLTGDAADHGSSSNDYAASIDVTQYVIDNGAGNYYVGDIVSNTGATGIYASWQLIVVVKNAARSLKNIVIYDGYDSIYGSSTYPDTITVGATGFITPTGTEPFNANLFVYAGETDDSYGDSSRIKDGSGAWKDLVDGQNDTSDVMNASVSSPDYTDGYRSNDAGMADPNFRNVLGVDIDKLVINDKLDTTQQFLSNGQTATQIELSSTGDRYSLIMFAFETEVFVPEFCYDYAYTQRGKYFTESNDGNQSPRLTGDVVPGEPIEVTIFLKSLVDSSIQIQNMELHVDDINTTQAEYIPNTADDSLINATKVAKIDDLYPVKVSVNAGTAAGMDYIHDIPIGVLNQNEYFYAYYSLDPKIEDLDMPINVTATYKLSLGTTSVDYDLILSKEIPLCSTSNFEYKPAKGIFNVAHNDYYFYDQPSGGAKHYNLPTQVTKREGDFKVLAMDPDDFDELLFDHPPTVVAVEMIDAGAFHFTEASCKEMTSSISPRVWIILDENTTSASFNKAALQAAIDNGMTYLTDTTEFYTRATQNTAFRITYNSMDENDTLPYLAKDEHGGSDTWSVLNWNSSWTGDDCNQDMITNGLGNDNTIASYCNLTGGSPDTVALCMECLYGLNTKFVCSRDNFAIRPEAFMLKLNDQEQDPTVPTTTIVRFRDDVSGVTTPNTTQVELAAGYKYKLEVNATNHLGNDSSLGYTKTFGLDSNDTTEYQWPTSGAPIGCNDETNSTISFKILDGAIDLNTSLDQVGVYRLHMHDETWTSVDHDPAFMTHHDDSTYFDLDNPDDCIVGNSTTQVINSNNKNGCNISSNHSASATTLEYRDYDVEFHPYKFDLTTITPTTGLNHSAVTATSFVYMTDMNFNSGQDENMSYHLNGFIKAYGENNSPLDNFVTNCYAKPLEIDVDKSTINLPVAYQYRFHSLDENGSNLRTDNADLNNSGNVISVLATDFPKLLDGAADTIFNLNYNRTNNAPMNPEVVAFNRYDVDCSAAIVATECTFQADLTSAKTSIGSKDLNSSISINHYYGRTHAPRNRFVGAVGNAFIYYEVFCNGITGGTTCDKTLLQNGLNSRVTDDPRWFRNEAHTVLNDGRAGLIDGSDITQKNATRVTTGALTEIAGRTTTPLTYDTSRGYPYKATMEDNASRWLFYNQYSSDQNESRNEFEVEFVSDTSNWAGKAESTSTTGEVGSKKTNRRSMW